MKIYITVNGKAISFATTSVLIFALISFIAMTNLSLTYAATKDNGFNSNTTTTTFGPPGYIPPPTTTTTQNDQIANNNNPSTANTIGSSSSSSSGQSQLKQGQQQQQPDSNNSNTVSMVGHGTINPDKTTTSNPATTSTQQQQPFNCGTNNMMMCGSTINPDKTTTSNPATTSTQQQQQPDSSNCNTKFMVGCGSTINPDKTTTSNPTNQPSTTIQNPTTNLGGGPTNQLVNPTAFNYQTNPATPSVDISKDPTQKISSAVTNSFGQGVPNIPVSIQVKDPAGKTAFLSTDKTDNNGKNVVSFPVKTAGTWTALVVISSNATVGGPFSDQITWNAISGGTHSNLTSLVNLARTIVTLSDDPREQIITTVKDPAGKGVKDIALRIKLTNPDAVSTTFSRITDANGVDQFVIPVDKVGNWVATLTLKDPNGETVPITDVAWKAIP